jgi:hypothetical protein
MIDAEDFKKQMRETIAYQCPTGGCDACPLYLKAAIGIIDSSDRLDSTRCMSLLASYLDREWKKWDEKHPPKVPTPIIDAEAEQIKIHMKAPE